MTVRTALSQLSRFKWFMSTLKQQEQNRHALKYSPGNLIYALSRDVICHVTEPDSLRQDFFFVSLKPFKRVIIFFELFECSFSSQLCIET